MRNLDKYFSFDGDDDVQPIILDTEIQVMENSPVPLASETVDVEEQFVREFWRLQSERFSRYMPVYKKTLQERVARFRQEPSNQQAKEAVEEKLHQYSLNFLDFTTEVMQEMFGWSAEQKKKAVYLLYQYAVQPHEQFLIAQLGKSNAEIAESGTPDQHWRAEQFSSVYNAGIEARKSGTDLVDELGELPVKTGDERVSGKDLILNQAGWYATEATVAFTQNLMPNVPEEKILSVLTEIFSQSDSDLQELVTNPQTSAETVQAQIVMFALQAANLTWIQIQPYRAALYGDPTNDSDGDFNRIDIEKATYFKPFLSMLKEKEWPAALLDRDQILQGIRIKQQELQDKNG